ncbi:MAG: hypothetical protein A2X84_02025 [Desulfuromonadaceae bacterium GWC2_58_13]|nr:MAG: hypothetical protein A2X84_02025 [Desulfuromonadaceae bacterium GWC2_58_13]
MREPVKSDDSPLNTLLEAERAIENQLECERIRARQWLDGKKAEINRRVVLESDHIEANLRHNLAEKKKEAEKSAEAMIDNATTLARRLAAIDSTSLRDLILRHLAPIDPRTRNDRPDVKN